MTKKHIFITGGAGFIGFHLQRELAKENRISCVDILDSNNLVAQQRARQLLGVEQVDIRHSFIPLNEKIDLLIHLAALTGISRSAMDPKAYLDVNVNGTFNMLEEARKNNIKHIIYASSSSVYTPSEGAVNESSCTNHPLSFYGATKKMSEVMVENYCKQHGMVAIGLRFFTVYGSWTRQDMAAFKFLQAIDQEKEIIIYNPDSLKRDFTHVSDIVQGICRLIKVLTDLKPGSHEIFNIGFGQPTLVHEFAEELARNMGKNMNINPGVLPINEVMSTHANTDKLVQFTGFKPKVSVSEGVQELVNWYKHFTK